MPVTVGTITNGNAIHPVIKAAKIAPTKTVYQYFRMGLIATPPKLVVMQYLPASHASQAHNNFSRHTYCAPLYQRTFTLSIYTENMISRNPKRHNGYSGGILRKKQSCGQTRLLPKRLRSLPKKTTPLHPSWICITLYSGTG